MNFNPVSIPFQSRFRQFLCTDASYYPELPKGKSASVLTTIKTEKKFMTMPRGDTALHAATSDCEPPDGSRAYERAVFRPHAFLDVCSATVLVEA